MRDVSRPRLLLLLPTTTYRADDFVDAAARVGADLTVASERPSTFSEHNPSGLLTIDLADVDRARGGVAAFAARYPVSAVIGVDDETAVVAAAVAESLGLPHNPVTAVEAARDKHRQREALAARGVSVPAFSLHHLGDDPRAIAGRTRYPCVIKPVALSASRGVMRVDDPDGFVAAHRRLAAILDAPDALGSGRPTRGYLVEAFIAGPEFALEGLVRDGRFHPLAVFDKPDPLEGPYFEETIYVTPSRHPGNHVEAMVACAQEAVSALGLERGPVHVELRHNAAGPWLIELAARPIGGKCARVLRFGRRGEESLEELLLRDALGRLDAVPPREPQAAGVMMIPIPRRGVLRSIDGIEAARRVPGITDIVISVHRGQELVPLPEGSRYLGFIFARGAAPEQVEAALRGAHEALVIEVENGR
jgi:pyrimidine deaminase RibD-like protein